MRHLGWLVVVLGAVGCGGRDTEQGKPWKTEEATAPDPQAQAQGAKFLLRDEPTGARGVKDVRLDKEVKSGDEVVVVGRVGGRDKPLVKDHALFLMVGLNLKPAMECDCPWDFCESDPKDLKESRATVKFVDEQGKTLALDAAKAFDIQPLSTVVVKGKAVRDDAGNLSVVASGLYVKQKVYKEK